MIKSLRQEIKLFLEDWSPPKTLPDKNDALKKTGIWGIPKIPRYLGNSPDSQVFGEFPRFPKFL